MVEDDFSARVLSQIEGALKDRDIREANKVLEDIMLILATGGETAQPSFTMGLMYEKMGSHLNEILAEKAGIPVEDQLETLVENGEFLFRFKQG